MKKLLSILLLINSICFGITPTFTVGPTLLKLKAIETATAGAGQTVITNTLGQLTYTPLSSVQTSTSGLLPNTTSLTINGVTKTFTSTPNFTVDLQSATDNGATTTNSIVLNSGSDASESSYLSSGVKIKDASGIELYNMNGDLSHQNALYFGENGNAFDFYAGAPTMIFGGYNGTIDFFGSDVSISSTNFKYNSNQVATVNQLPVITASTNITVSGTTPNYTISSPSQSLSISSQSLSISGGNTITIPTNITQTVTNGVTTTSPSEDAVYDFIQNYLSTVKRLTASVTNNTNTATVASDLTYSLAANSTYIIRGTINVGCDASGGIKLGANFPSGSTSSIGAVSRGSTNSTVVWNTYTTSGTLTTQVNTANSAYGYVQIDGMITTGSNSGNFEIIFASTTGGQVSTLYVGYLEYIKL